MRAGVGTRAVLFRAGRERVIDRARTGNFMSGQELGTLRDTTRFYHPVAIKRLKVVLLSQVK